MDPGRRPSSGGRSGAPRGRGDGPGPDSSVLEDSSCSPRTRGWTHGLLPAGPRPVVLPADAGMDPPRSLRPTPPGRAPRGRGDGPRYLSEAQVDEPAGASRNGGSLRVVAGKLSVHHRTVVADPARRGEPEPEPLRRCS